jgi:hypothetical protein
MVAKLVSHRSCHIVLVCAGMLQLLCGCRGAMTEHKVRDFIDAADHAFVAGRASDICRMRSGDFKLTATTFKLAQGHIVAGLAEAEAIEEQRHEAGERLSGETMNMNLQQYCRMALEAHEFYKRATLERSDLRIEFVPGAKRAVVHAHYIVREPVYAYNDSPLGNTDRSERQIATLQTDTEEESVVSQDGDGQLVFSSTTAVSKAFQIPKQRDRRL